MIAVHTGLRRSELLNLRRSDINIEERYVLVRKSKNGEIRHVPINTLLMKTLKSVINNTDSDYLFVGPKGDLRHSFGSKLSIH